MTKYIWGVDSSINVTNELYQCVLQNYGLPSFWGRYLTRVPNASEGLTKEEISFIKSKGIKIVPIYNNFRRAIGIGPGRTAAANAIFHAKRLGAPKGTVIFANIEKFFEVDAEWIIAWVEKIYLSGYRTGFYHYPVTGHFNKAFCEAVQINEKVKNQSVLWSAEPELGATTEKKAPNFLPTAPVCKKDVWIWQYGRDAKQCAIDTNLADQRIFSYLW